MGDTDGLPISVKITHSKAITEHIPEDVSRARAGAWLDMISPITEWAGLKGDELRHKRDLLRLEREQNLFELAQRLKKKLEGKRITPIKNKILVPALERASLESPGNDFVERWANLLAAEALQPADDTGLFSAILAEMGVVEANFLDKIKVRLVEAGVWAGDRVGERSEATEIFLANVGDQAIGIMSELLDGKVETEIAWSKLERLFESSPHMVFGVHYMRSSTVEQWINARASPEEVIAVDILEARNLMTRPAYRHLQPDDIGLVSINYFGLTNLGVRFLQRVSPP